LQGSVSIDVRRATAGLALVVLALAIALAPRPATAPPQAPGTSASAYGKLPLSFVPNRGQIDSRVRYSLDAPGVSTFFLRDRISIALSDGERGQALELRFVGANPRAKIDALDRRGGRVNYITRSEHHTNIPTFGTLAYRDLWPGIDLVFTGASGRLKYEFRVAGGADPRSIQLAYAGVDALSVTESGALAVRTRTGTLTDAAPRTYQPGGAAVDSRFVVRGDRAYGFAVGAYDTGRPLVIDPSLEYSTYIGGAAWEWARADEVDAQGNVYLTGIGQYGYPKTPGAFDPRPDSGLIVTKVNAAGTGLVFSTRVGEGDPHELTLDAAGNVYVTGQGQPPTTPGAFDTTYTPDSGAAAFLFKLSSDGSTLVYSTLIDRSVGYDVAVDSSGSAFVTGIAADSYQTAVFPTTPGAYDRTFNGYWDAFVTKFDPSGSSVTYSTYIGGQTLDVATGIKVDASGNAYLAGWSQPGSTLPPAYPTTPGAYDTSPDGITDGFATKLDQTGSQLLYSTYLGGSGYDQAMDLALNEDGDAYIAGSTSSSDFPTTAGAFDSTLAGGYDGFVTKLNRSGSNLGFSTLIGGAADDFPGSIALGAGHSPHIAGITASADFPTAGDAFDTSYNGNNDAFVSRVGANGASLLYSTFLGGSGNEESVSGYGGEVVGIALDPQGRAYVTGGTSSTDYPTTPGAYDTTPNGGLDVFLTKLAVGPGAAATLVLSPDVATNTLGAGGHCVTATVEDGGGTPVPGIDVGFTVSGATSASGTETTDASGEATYCYQGPELQGTDQITATVEPSGPSDTATKTWVVPSSTDGCRAKGNGRITAQNDDPATFEVDVRARTSSDARGRVGYTDYGPADPFALKSKAIGALVCEGRRGTIFGTAGSTPFRIDVEDRGRPGRRDTYRILLGSGYDSGTQTLDSGDLRVRG
jgi:Bacterial Ig-like domain (group 1)/Beta-propeller repeat